MHRSKQRTAPKKTVSRQSRSSAVQTRSSSLSTLSTAVSNIRGSSGVASISHAPQTSSRTISLNTTRPNMSTSAATVSRRSFAGQASAGEIPTFSTSSSHKTPLKTVIQESPAQSSLPISSNAFQSSTPTLSKHKRYTEPATKVVYTVPRDRVRAGGYKVVKGYRNADGTFPEIPSPADPTELRRRLMQYQQDLQDQRAAEIAEGIASPRKYSLRKQYLYHRNREIIERAKMVMVIQPANEAEFQVIMEQLQGSFTTAHFRNGLVHLQDKSYAGLREFFKGPVKVLLQEDDEKIFSSLKRLQRVLKDHPNCLFLGGAVDGFAGVSHDFQELFTFESKRHIQGQIIGVLNNVNAIIPAIQNPTNQLAFLLHHHGEQVSKQEQ